MKDIKDFKSFCHESRSYVVVKHDNSGDMCFWTGTDWGDRELAKLYYKVKDAKDAFKKSEAEAIIQDHGLRSEWVVYGKFDESLVLTGDSINKDEKQSKFKLKINDYDFNELRLSNVEIDMGVEVEYEGKSYSLSAIAGFSPDVHISGCCKSAAEAARTFCGCGGSPEVEIGMNSLEVGEVKVDDGADEFNNLPEDVQAEMKAAVQKFINDEVENNSSIYERISDALYDNAIDDARDRAAEARYDSMQEYD